MGFVRFKVLDEGDEATIAALRDALGENDFDAAWAEGAALSIEEATAYALRGRGERKRATSGWGSLTRAELDVVKHVSRRPWQQGGRRAAFRLTAYGAGPPDAHLHQARADLAGATRTGGCQAQLTTAETVPGFAWAL